MVKDQECFVDQRKTNGPGFLAFADRNGGGDGEATRDTHEETGLLGSAEETGGRFALGGRR